MNDHDNPVIGYSAMALYDDSYEYLENACYIADSPKSLEKFLEDAIFHPNDYRIDTITLSDILDDYGCSWGEYAMEPEALKRFEQLSGSPYSVTPFDDFFDAEAPEVFIVRLDRKIYKPVEEFTIPEILAALKIFDHTYKREEIDAAIGLKDRITPHLIAILENLLADPQPYIEDESLYDHIYAVMLLGHFKEPKAHQVIIDIFSLADDVPDQLFGDICTADLPVILLNTCNGAIENIKSMILNRKADNYCRLSACQALAYAVVEGHILRENALGFFNSLFTGAEADEISDFWSLLAMIILDLYPEESMEVIKQAYDDELIFSGMVQFSDFEKTLLLGRDKCLEKLKTDLEKDSLDDIHARMSWWHCFAQESKAFPSAGFDDGMFSGYSKQVSDKVQKDKKKNKKKKRKQAKASKKKNRR